MEISKDLREIESIDKERLDSELSDSDSDDDKENQFKLQHIDIEKKRQLLNKSKEKNDY